MLLPKVTALTLFDVFDRGVANRERIMILANESVHTGQYCLVVGWLTKAGEPPAALPWNNHFFWFGDAVVNQGEVIFVYTGPGEARRTKMATGHTSYAVHWGKDTTIFADNRVVPMLLRLSEILIAPPAAQQPQLPQLTND